MTNPLKLALPVMLHDATEVEAFKAAKPRIERYLDSWGMPTEVGVFCYMAPFAIADKARRQAQLEVQRKERFPIYHAQTPIIANHSLDFYGRDRAQAIANGCLLETAIEHSGNLREYSPTHFDADVHAGVFVYPDIVGNRVLGPATYTLEAFMQSSEQILQATVAGFQALEQKASDRGLGLLLENEPLASFEKGSIDGFRSPRLIYKPFGTHLVLEQISNRRTFDTAHFASTTNVPGVFTDNGIDPRGFFRMLGLDYDRPDDWTDYNATFCTAENYLGKHPGAIHLSNFIGIGVHLSDRDLVAKWGRDGTNDGSLSPEAMKYYLEFATDRQIPVVLEVDFDIARIGDNQFIEADDFLRHVFRDGCPDR